MKTKPTRQQTPGRLRHYYPELAAWMINSPKQGETHTFEISENRNKAIGQRVATITVDAAFSPAMAHRIAVLLGFAPDLWRSLREAAPWLKEDIEGLKAFADAEALLWDSAHRRPYDFPHAHCDEDIFKRQMQQERAGEIIEGKPDNV